MKDEADLPQDAETWRAIELECDEIWTRLEQVSERIPPGFVVAHLVARYLEEYFDPADYLYMGSKLLHGAAAILSEDDPPDDDEPNVAAQAAD